MVIEGQFEQVSRKGTCKMVNLTPTNSALVPTKNFCRVLNSVKTPPVDSNSPASSVQLKISPIIILSKIAPAVNYVNTIRPVLGHNNSNINLKNEDPRIYAKSTSDQQKVIANLTKNGIDYFTYAESSPRPSAP